MEIGTAVKDITSEMKALFGTNLREVILFGSYSRGDFDEWSDLDVMVLVNESNESIRQLEAKVLDISTAIGQSHGLLTCIIVQNYEFFEHWTEFLPFYETVRKEGKQYYVAA